jgi:hypothetical protein
MWTCGRTREPSRRVARLLRRIASCAGASRATQSAHKSVNDLAERGEAKRLTRTLAANPFARTPLAT